MKIELKEVKVKDLYKGYSDNEDDGVVAYGGRLDVRPAYQREFVYKDKQRNAVIETIMHGFPLNVMYWNKSGIDEDGNALYELLDGQQRTISICQYLNGGFSIDSKYIHNLTDEEREKIENYELLIYTCEGTEREKLDWFKIINIAGEKLTDQELRNAVYTGSWLMEAKKYFSKNQCVAYKIGQKYISGSPIRQDYLEKVLEWVCNRDNLENIEDYMAIHQHDKNINDIKIYYNNVITWVDTLFPNNNYRKEMKGLPWGTLYNKYNKNDTLDAKELEKEIEMYMQDEDITNKKGIYEYLLSLKEEERVLNIRAFTEKQKREKYEEQKGICPYCEKEGNKTVYKLEDMEADHITPWCDGGHTTIENLQMLCKKHNRKKSDK